MAQRPPHKGRALSIVRSLYFYLTRQASCCCNSAAQKSHFGRVLVKYLLQPPAPRGILRRRHSAPFAEGSWDRDTAWFHIAFDIKRSLISMEQSMSSARYMWVI
ncbi:MAG: hypothetical protein CM15mP74_31220 [Halieaceae bacterium]|nr:MAG: hypothetical protein CM15mP74_31220 [Halieaceae bacterium]